MYMGEKVRLREYRKQDLEQAVKFINDQEVKSLLQTGIPYPMNLEDEHKWYDKNSANNDTYSFAIETLDEERYIGGCGINEIDWKNRVAMVGIFIGNKKYWNQGYGTDAMRTLLKFIFDEMNINKVKLKVASFNERAMRSYQKCGYQKEGVLRQEIFNGGKYHDEIIMGILQEEYLQNSQ